MPSSPASMAKAQDQEGPLPPTRYSSTLCVCIVYGVCVCSSLSIATHVIFAYSMMCGVILLLKVCIYGCSNSVYGFS